jgi:hypothetical protein
MVSLAVDLGVGVAGAVVGGTVVAAAAWCAPIGLAW